MAKPHHADLDLFTGEPVKPETRAEKKAKQKEAHLRSEGMPGITIERLRKSSTSIKSKRTHWSKGESTKHTACGAPSSVGYSSILVELVTCDKCQDKAKESWQNLIRPYAIFEVQGEDYD